MDSAVYVKFFLSWSRKMAVYVTKILGSFGVIIVNLRLGDLLLLSAMTQIFIFCIFNHTTFSVNYIKHALIFFHIQVSLLWWGQNHAFFSLWTREWVVQKVFLFLTLVWCHLLSSFHNRLGNSPHSFLFQPWFFRRQLESSSCFQFASTWSSSG